MLVVSSQTGKPLLRNHGIMNSVFLFFFSLIDMLVLDELYISSDDTVRMQPPHIDDVLNDFISKASAILGYRLRSHRSIQGAAQSSNPSIIQNRASPRHPQQLPYAKSHAQCIHAMWYLG